MKYLIALLLTVVFTLPISAQEDNPKLVVGIVVDQMRYDYLTRFDKKFGENGFKRMMREGFNCKNNHFNYVPHIQDQDMPQFTQVQHQNTTVLLVIIGTIKT